VSGESEADCTRPANIDMSSGVLARRRQLGSISRARAMTFCACLSRPPRVPRAADHSHTRPGLIRDIEPFRQAWPVHQAVQRQ
jgi:hypothetical protein